MGPMVISDRACGRSPGALTTGLMRVLGPMNRYARASLAGFPLVSMPARVTAMKQGVIVAPSLRRPMIVIVRIQHFGEALKHLRELTGMLCLIGGRVRADRDREIFDRCGEVGDRHAVEQRRAGHLRYVPRHLGL